jgi:cytochrome c oxidase cbb3-type subunit 3
MKTPPPEPELRPHTYDGIREYNQRLPNWWLFTLYGAIIFAVGYWGYYQWIRAAPQGPRQVEAMMTQIEAIKLANTAANRVDDPSLWAMSRNPVFIQSGKKTFEANCVPCHLASLRGKSENPQAIGPDLTDQIWIHGGRPTDSFKVVQQGVPAKGMPTWGPILGDRRIGEVVAYVYSHHKEGEPVIDAANPVPGPK